NRLASLSYAQRFAKGVTLYGPAYSTHRWRCRHRHRGDYYHSDDWSFAPQSRPPPGPDRLWRGRHARYHRWLAFRHPLYQRAQEFSLELMSFDVAPSQDLDTT